MIGYAICGSFCTIGASLTQLETLARTEEVLPIISERAAATDTRFGPAKDIVARCAAICGREPVRTVVDAEPLGPANPLELLIIAPCTGNTLAKMACGITDGTVTMAAKAHARRGGTTLIALCSNDAMSANLANLAIMSARRNCYFVPMVQDDPVSKPYSLVADMSLLPGAIAAARRGEQLRPLFLERRM